ncbi:MAG: aconitate hydratase [Candidatus Altiarchaeota archaeon]|nr:aconitate hydratase [Candidatus Altiarchaeota archaeon]
MVSVAEKIIKTHTISDDGKEIELMIDQTLTQDATGTMAYLQFEALRTPKVKTELSVSYVDHNTLQSGPFNADDHEYLRTVASKYGILFSKAGNGICHQVHLENFAKPGKTLLGSDSHTPNAGGLGMVAIGAGGLDVALAMAGQPFTLKKQKIVGVKLTGKLKPWVSAKDVILEVLRRTGVKGGVGKIMEYFGEGLKTLSVPERATITNMGAELGATTSVFPSDDVTLKFLKAHGREKDWSELTADDESYDEVIEIDLAALEPLIAKPHSPGNVVKVSDVEGVDVNQVCIGSCTNSSLKDLKTAAKILKGKTIHPTVSLTVSPGSKQVLSMLAGDGGLSALVKAGARILECACGPCIGMGQSPPSRGVSVRTFNRNFEGRSGTKDAQVYLSSVETAVATALNGKLTDPRKLGEYPAVEMPLLFDKDESTIIKPSGGDIIRGPNIKPLPINTPLSDNLSGEVLLKVGDDISTDHIMPAGSKILPLRSNIPEISKYVFEVVDSTFHDRAKEKGGGVIVGGANYGQGSSREHAALAPMYLGIKAVFAKSFARIHMANLINFGILPLTFKNPKDYDHIKQGDNIVIEDIVSKIENPEYTVKIAGKDVSVTNTFSKKQVEILKAGGLLNLHVKCIK